MKKIITWIVTLFIGISCLVGCGGASFKLNFMVDNTVYATVSTKGKETIQMPANPVKEDYTFDGWYWDKDTWKNEFTARSLLDTPLSSNMEVYAHFIDESYLKGTDINIKGSTKLNVQGIGEVFYLTVRNSQLVCKFNNYVEINPHSTWTLSTDIGGNKTIASKTVEVSVGDNPLYYIYVTDKNDNHETYIVLVHRNYMFNVSFNGNGGSTPTSQTIEEGFYLENIPTSSREGYTFNNWDYDFKNKPIKSNVTAKAQWKANEYTITYKPNGGAVSSTTQKVTYDSNYSLLTPTRNGYTFKGWSKNGSYMFPMSGKWTLASDIDFTAYWEIVYYSCSYELNGGTANGILKSSYTVEDTFNLPSVSKTGYTFNGWSTSSNLNNAKEDYVVQKGTTGNLKFYAKFTANTYTITYDVNGGDELPNNTQNVTFDSNSNLITPTKTGYGFSGWYDGSTKVDNNGNWKYTSDKTLTAHWTPTNYQITYDLDEGVNNPLNPTTYNIESSTITLSDPSKTGYTFIGWTNSDVTTPTKNLFIESGSTGNKEFKANWSANKYKINFDVNGGNALAYESKDFIFDSTIVLDAPTRPGYTFAGWYYDTELVTSGVWKIADNITLVARWSIIDFNIQYDLKDGINDGSNPSTYTYDEEDITLADPSKTGYTFLGWTSSEYEIPTKSIVVAHNSTGDLKFTANWQANTYNVVLDVNNGNKLEDNSIEIVFDENIALPIPTRTGYSFSGWFYNSTKVKDGVWKIASNATLKAKWTPNQYTITKENGSGAGSSVVTYDSSYNLGISSKDGYTFTGYYTGEYGAGSKYTDENGNSLSEYTDTTDLTLYASFTYKIKFISNGGSYVPDLILNENECLSNTIASEKENRTFAGWYTDEKLTQPVSYSKSLGNITLYAKWAEEVSPNQLTYTCSNGNITINGSSYSGTDLIIPSHIGGNPVSTIDSSVFSGFTNIKTIVVPDTVSSIGNGAFKGCSSLESITLPFTGKSESSTGYEACFGYIFGYEQAESGRSSLTYTDWKAPSAYGTTYYRTFSIPKSIRNVTITRQTTIHEKAFMNCSFIENIHLIDSTSFADDSFKNCNATIYYDVVPTTSSAWDGISVATGYHGGTGTVEDPYQIFTPSEFMYFVEQVNKGVDYSNTYFVLTSNIDLANYSINQISPTSNSMFNGTFDGNGKTIRNVNVICVSNDYIGMFGFVSGTIKNVKFDNLIIDFNSDESNTYYCGLLVGNLSGSIENINVSGKLTITCKKTCYTGGLIGYNTGNLVNCVSNISINATSTNYKCYAGGLIGYNTGDYTSCSFTGSIVAKGYSDNYTVSNDYVGFDE